MLEEGVKLLNATSLSSNEVLFISEGTTLVNDYNYHPNSYLPTEFREISKEEESVLICNNEECPDDVNDCIALFKSPEGLVDSIKKSRIDSFQATKDYYSFLSDNKELLNDIDSELKKFVSPLQTSSFMKFLGFSISKPVLSTGRDIKNNKFFGLHIDTSGQPFGVFKRPNRILINCGNSTRYFYYMNINVKNLISKVESGAENEKVLCTSFLETFPNYPVISVKLLPWYGYIAPTDNIIHDGCSLTFENDCVVSLLGDFNPKKLLTV